MREPEKTVNLIKDLECDLAVTNKGEASIPGEIFILDAIEHRRLRDIRISIAGVTIDTKEGYFITVTGISLLRRH